MSEERERERAQRIMSRKRLVSLSLDILLSRTQSVYSTDWHWDVAMRLCFPRIFSMPQYVRSQGDLTCKILETFRTSLIPGSKKKGTENSEQCYSHRSINMPEVRGGFFLYGSHRLLPLWAPAKRPIRNFLTFIFFLFSLLATSHQAPMKHDSAHKLRNC